MSCVSGHYEVPFYVPKSVISGDCGAVSSNHHLATQAGLEVLEKGGNAADAAVAVSLVLSVVEPHHSGIGGGCLALYYSQEHDRTYAYDGRGTAPKKSHRDMFLNKNGEVDESELISGGKSVVVPGLLKTCQLMLERHGTMSFSELAKPAIKAAEDGFSTTHLMSIMHRDEGVRIKMEKHSSLRKLFMPNEKPFEYGEKVSFKEKAALLRKLSDVGIDEFYNGQVANDIVESINCSGGVFSKEDLASYEPRLYEPVTGCYRDVDIVSICPPSSGGAHIIEMLNILEHFDLSGLGHNSAASIHYIAEAMKIAFADRSVAMGDPNYLRVKLDRILSKSFASLRARLICENKASSYGPAEGIEPTFRNGNTSHFSIMDRFGNVVSQTNTIRDWLGSGIVTNGFVLNNTMSDFSAKENNKTTQGLSYFGGANAISAGKVPLSSMSPTILFRKGKPFLAVGAAGGPRIISSTLQAIINVVDFKMNISEAIRAPHINCFTLEQGLELEPGVSVDTIEMLIERGHLIKKAPVNNGLTFFSNGVMTENDRYYSGHPHRVDGGAGVLLKNGGSIIESIAFS